MVFRCVNFFVYSILGLTFFVAIKFSDKEKIVVEKVKPPYSSLIRLTRNGETRCSGVVINDTTAITARHCIDDVSPESILVVSDDGKQMSTPSYFTNYERRIDLALISGDFKTFEKTKVYLFFVIKDHFPRLSNSGYSCGYIGEEAFCSSFDKLDFKGFNFKSNAMLIPGMSGGPLLLEVNNKLYLIGVNSRTDSESDNTTLYTSVAVISFKKKSETKPFNLEELLGIQGK